MEQLRLIETKYKHVLRLYEKNELQKIKTQLSNLYRTIEGQCHEEEKKLQCTCCYGSGMLFTTTPRGGCIERYEVSSCGRCQGSGIEKQIVIVRK